MPVDTAVRLLANKDDRSMVRLDDVFYLTTPEKAKRLREEQAQINGEGVLGERPRNRRPTKPRIDGDWLATLRRSVANQSDTNNRTEDY